MMFSTTAFVCTPKHTLTEAICPQPDRKSSDLHTDEVEAPLPHLVKLRRLSGEITEDWPQELQ